MEDSLGKCAVCGKEASAIYPLLPNSPAFCSSHHNSKDAGPFGCDFSGPDDFDIPFEDFLPVYRRETFIWTDKNGDKHPLKDIDDGYLQNIINFLKNKLSYIPPFEDAPKIGIASNEYVIAGLENIIEFLVEEKKVRGKHGW